LSGVSGYIEIIVFGEIRFMSKNLKLSSPAELSGLRANLLKDAWEASQAQGLASRSLHLEALVALMKERSLKHPELSSLYFAGAFEDHPYCLKTDRIAVGLAVLPEDAPKAGLWKRHPHQQEAIFVLQGALKLIIENQPAEEVEAGELRVIEKGQCHRIVPDDNHTCVYLFVKTHPTEEPISEGCG
jgi:quercetin dioxygenase-like cupin family protein